MEVHAGKWMMMCITTALTGNFDEVDKVTAVSFKTEKQRKEVISYARKVGIMLPDDWGRGESAAGIGGQESGKGEEEDG